MMVSIIIPVYQVAPYIGDCLLSVMSQTFTGAMECLLVDDCGTDESIDIAQKMIEAYEGSITFKVLHHERNRGLSAARNTGMVNAVGDYLFFLDSDDEITPDCIEKLMAMAIEYPQAEMIQGNNYSHSVTGKPAVRNKDKAVSVVVTNNNVRKSFYCYDTFIVAAWNKLFRRSVLESNQMKFQEGVIIEDTLWTFQLLKKLSCVCFVFQDTYHYRIRKNSIVTGFFYQSMAESVRVIYRYILTSLSPGYEQEEFNFYAKSFCFFYVRFLSISPGFKEDLPQWQTKAADLGYRGVRFRLKVSSYLAKVRYGWLVMSLIKWIGSPSMALLDMQRILNTKVLVKNKRD